MGPNYGVPTIPLGAPKPNLQMGNLSQGFVPLADQPKALPPALWVCQLSVSKSFWTDVFVWAQRPALQDMRDTINN